MSRRNILSLALLAGLATTLAAQDQLPQDKKNPDGKAQDLGWERELTGRDRPLRVRLPVSQARELTLAVDFGSTGDVQGHVNWADARLIK